MLKMAVKNKPWISLMVRLVVYKIITLCSDLKNPPSHSLPKLKLLNWKFTNGIGIKSIDVEN